MKNNIRDTNNKELQEIIANTILLPDISNLDCLHEPITASFGLLLLYAQLYHYSENKERLFSKIVDIINAIRPLASLYAQNRNIGLFGGLCDFGISLLAINKETGTYHRLIDSVNTVVASEAADNSLLLENKIDSKSISMRDYDSILGLSGILRYLLLTDSELYRESIQKVVDALIYLSQYSTDKQEAVPNWHIQKDNVFPFEERESYRSGMINFGLSHGIAGPLAVLSVAKLQGINRPGLAEAIGRLIEFFLCFVQEQPDGEVYWPSAITGEEYLKPALSISPHKRLSWCYGSLSILRSLFLASKAVSNEKIQIWAVNKAIRFTKMPLEKYLFESPTICHGYSGALILFESFYRDTHETAFLDAIERLQRKICSMNSMSYKYGFQNIDWIKGKYNIEDDLSLLSGASGVLLALSSRYCTCSYLLAHLLIT